MGVKIPPFRASEGRPAGKDFDCDGVPDAVVTEGGGRRRESADSEIMTEREKDEFGSCISRSGYIKARTADLLADSKYPGSPFPLNTLLASTGGLDDDVVMLVQLMKPFCIYLCIVSVGLIIERLLDAQLVRRAPTRLDHELLH